MSGQFPTHHRLPVGTPPTMENLSGWNHSAHRQAHGSPLSQPDLHQTSRGMMPQAAHLPGSLSQLTSHGPWPSKPPGSAHNGSGNGVSSNSITGLGLPSSTSSNPMFNLRMFVNQDPNRVTSASGIHLPAPPSVTQTGSVDLSCASRTSDQGQTEPISLVSTQTVKESHHDVQNGGVISSVGSLGPVNGDVNTHSPTVVSVIASAPKCTGSASKIQTDSVGVSKCVNQLNSFSGDQKSVLVGADMRPNSLVEDLSGTDSKSQSSNTVYPSFSVLSGNTNAPDGWDGDSSKLSECDSKFGRSLYSPCNKTDYKSELMESEDVSQATVEPIKILKREVATDPVKVECSEMEQDTADAETAKLLFRSSLASAPPPSLESFVQGLPSSPIPSEPRAFTPAPRPTTSPQLVLGTTTTSAAATHTSSPVPQASLTGLNSETNMGTSPIPASNIPIKTDSSAVQGTSQGCDGLKQDVIDVESQMEALFAGIADDGNGGKTTPNCLLTSTDGTPNIAAVLESKGSASRKGKQKGARNGIRRSSDSIFGTSSAESTPRKFKQKKRTSKDDWMGASCKKTKKGAIGKGQSKFIPSVQSYDSGSNASSSRIRGPVVHIEGPKDAPTRITVINAPSRADDEDNDSRKKSLGMSRTRKSYQSEGKITSSGLCSNTLVARYESHPADTQWICVFCKMGPHVGLLGDLFGPYLVGQDENHELTSDMETDRKHSDKKEKKSKRGSEVCHGGLQGLLAIPAVANEPQQSIIWAHEDCLVWSGGVHLIGSRLDGLQEAVWEAVHTKCSKCHVGGANVGCVRHGCSRRAHYPCAVNEGWSMDEETFISTCFLHQKNYMSGSIFPP